MPLSDMLFVIEHSLAKEYSALSPFEIEERSFFKIIDLFIDLRKMQIRDKQESDPNRVIRRPAGDNWF